MSLRTVIAAAALAALVAGCGQASRVGEPAAHVRELTLLDPLTDTNEMVPFADAVARLSHGALRLRILPAGHQARTDYEAATIRDVQHDRAPLGWAGSRSWDAFGARRMAVLGAPLLIDSYALEGRVLRSDGIVQPMLAELRPLGLVGLGILPGPMRMPLSARAPLVTTAAYRGLRFGTQESDVADATMRTLGARPVREVVNAGLAGVDAIDRQASGIAGSRLELRGSHIAGNVNLWPRPGVLFANARAWAALPAADRDVLRRAAAATIDPTLALERANQAEGSAQLCRLGTVRFDRASAADLRALRRAVEPVYAELARDPGARDALAAISRLKASLGAPPDALAPCAGEPVVAATAPARSTIDGTWVMDTGRGAAKPDFLAENWGHWVFVFDGGHFADTQQNRLSCTWGYGTYTVTGHTTTWLFTDGGGEAPNQAENKPGEQFSFSLSSYRDTLTLSPVRGAISPINFRAKPWRRVSSAPSRAAFSKRCPPPAAALPD
jgi:TRAP-type C4-dicarboxylate transport system substrate-binding protein